MSNFLDSLGFTSGIDVYVTISCTNWLEMAVLEPGGNGIKHYFREPLEYDEAKREITNYEDFKNKLNKLFQACGVVASKANVYFSLPTIWFGYKDNLPLMVDDEALKNIVIGELEQTFIFKRQDPVPFWFDAPSVDTETKSIFYTAIQSEAMTSISNAFKELGANLISIDCSLFADLRGLIAVGPGQDLIDSGQQWSLMIVNNSGFQLFSLQGNDFLEYYEEPLPIKSYEGEEIYSAIDNAAQIALMSSMSSTLVIISETDLVSAEILGSRLQFNGQMITVEDNKYRTTPLAEICTTLKTEKQSQVSLHLIGRLANDEMFPIFANFLTLVEGYTRSDLLEIPLGNEKMLVLTPPKAMLWSLGILAIVVIPLSVLWFATGALNNKYVNELEELKVKVTNVDTELAQYDVKEGPKFDPIDQIEKVLKSNRMKIMAYSALGDSIPQDLYLNYFMTGDSGLIDIQGCAASVDDVYSFYQNMKDSLAGSNLRLSKLDLKSESIDEVINGVGGTLDSSPYVFEITNMDESQLTSFMNNLTGKGNDNAQNATTENNADDKTKGQQSRRLLRKAQPANTQQPQQQQQ